MANEHNLIPAKKGEIRNPKGRGKGIPNRATNLKYWLKTPIELIIPGTQTEENPDGKKYKGTMYDAISLGIIGQAAQGNVPAWSKIMDAIYGVEKSISEVETKGETQTINFYLPEKPADIEDEQLD